MVVSTTIKRAGILLGICTLLAFGLAGCGGDEAAPAVVTPPAPTPAPPPFQPQSVEVALGTSGTTVTLMTTEAGGYTRDGEAFTGGEVTAANGGRYALTLADGAWSAAYVADELQLTLGASGDALTLTSLEGGGYTLPDDTALEAGRVWTATTGGTYVLRLDAEGQPAADFVSEPATVALGALGGTLTLALQEDRATYLGPDGALVRSGDTVTRGGNLYVLTFAGGVWSAAYQPETATVALGASGTTQLTRAEDGSWRIGGTAFSSGGTVTAVDGTDYTLTLAGGVWSAVRQIETVQIAGTGLTATVLPGGGYDVNGQTLGAAGGDITVAGASYHVAVTADGMLSGVRFDAPIVGPVLRSTAGQDSGMTPTLSSDDRATVADEAGTQLSVGGAKFSVGDLLDSGIDSASGANIVAGAHGKVAALRARAVALVDLFESGGIERSALSTLLGSLWDEADDAIEDVVHPDISLERDINPRRVVDALDEVVDALATEDGFVAAVAGDGDGVLAGANISASTARTVFNRSNWEATSVLDSLGGTRFGAMYRREHPDADRSVSDVAREAFAWSTIESPQRTTDIRASGNAYYEGRTLAIDSGRNFYEGDIELQVNFVRSQVSGLVTNLARSDNGAPWEHGLGGAVEDIFLPEADLGRTASWTRRSGDARLSYSPSAGAFPDMTVGGSGFEGRLLGTGVDAGEEAMGVWNVSNLLAGGFGAVRGPDRVDPGESQIDDVTTRGTTLPGTTAGGVFGGSGNGFGWFDGANLKLENLERTFEEGQASNLDVKMALSTLLGDGFAPVSRDQRGQAIQQEVQVDNHVQAALAEIRDQRAFLEQWISLFGSTSGDAVARAQRDATLLEIIKVIDDELFGPKAENMYGQMGSKGAILINGGTGELAYPTTSGGRFQDSTVLARIDEVIEALSDFDAFQDAFDDDGLFDGLSEGLSPEAIWDKPKYRVLMTTDQTQFGRFGVWSLEHSPHASDNRDAVDERPRWQSAGRYVAGPAEPFAYSPLDQSTYVNANSPGYPGGLIATYNGKTVAVQGAVQYTGDVQARVQWDQSSLGGLMRVRLSDLTSTDPAYGPLQHGLEDNKDASGVYTGRRAGTFPVRAITFSSEITSDGGKLGFRGTERSRVAIEYDTFDGKPTPWIDTVNLTNDGKIQYWSGYSPVCCANTVDRVSDLSLDPSDTPQLNIFIAQQSPPDDPLAALRLTDTADWNPSTATTGILGSFVGQDLGGPLGLIGVWAIKDGTGSTSAGPHYLGVGQYDDNHSLPIEGAFGADVAP